MASRSTCRPLRNVLRSTRPMCECANMTTSRISSIRQVSATASRSEVNWKADKSERPRWSYTPEEMKAPFPWKPKDPTKAFIVNDDPLRLDQFYTNFLGRDGALILTDEIKWLAITHKSFDQGRRGFNDRLAFFGRRILNMQASMAIVHSPIGIQTQSVVPNDGREPFTHPALKGLANLADTPVGDVLTKSRLAILATTVGMQDIIRWQPRNPDKLKASGIDTVLNTCIYAIIGAIALQRGGEIAAQIAREKVLKPFGIL